VKILELAAYAYYKDHKGFEKNTSGFAYAVSDICESLAICGNEVYLLTQSGITNGFQCNNTVIIKKRWIDIILHSRLRDYVYGIIAAYELSGTFVEKLKTIYYYVNRGYTEKIISLINPDVIQIQSIGDYTVPFMMAASNSGIPFIVSNHGLATFLSEVEPKLKKLEGCFFKAAAKNHTIVTTVSSGIKKRIVNHYNIKGDNIIVVPNGVMPAANDIDEKKTIELRKKLNIKSADFVFICVGSISNRKNQLQVARAFRLLINKIENIKLLFAGDGPQFDELNDYVQNHGLVDKAVLLGNIEHSMMPYYYSISNCTIVASVDEGFGLPVIEGYSYGIPSVIYSDLDAIEDVSFADSTVIVNKRDDECLAEGMERSVIFDWNEEAIKKHALKFTNIKMGEKYQNALIIGMKQKSSMVFDDVKALMKGKGVN
jgi:glycosyltransferase involved in cell wall biosynthesis